MKVWTTKYALTAGVEVVNVGEEDRDGYVYTEFDSGGCIQYRLGKDAFKTKREALENAEQRRTKKIASLKKQIKKLEEKEFT